jgi:hypothetical protein
MADAKPADSKTSVVPPMVTLPAVNVVPPLGAPSFHSILEHHVPEMAHVPPMENQSQQAPASFGLKEVAEEIGKALKAGDLKKLHELQNRYDGLVAQIRQNAETAYEKAVESASKPVEPEFAQFLPKPKAKQEASKPLSAQKASLQEVKTTAPLSASAAQNASLTNAPILAPQNKTSIGGVKGGMPGLQGTSQRVKPSMATPANPASGHPVVPPLEAKPAPLLNQNTKLPGNGMNLNSQKIENGDKDMSNAFDVSNTVWEKVCEDPHVKTALLSLPTNAVEMYKEIPIKQKEELAKKLNEKTHVFLFTIDNKEAFISGKVMGRDAFQYLKDELDKQVKEGKLSLEEALQRQKVLDIMSTLTPEQRSALAALLEAEVQTTSSHPNS